MAAKAFAKVAVVLGAGPNIGTKVAEKFTSSGYEVAVVSRSGKSVPSSTAALSIAADFTHPETIHGVFEEVRSKLGEPSVVVYNAAAAAFPPATDVFSVDLKVFADDLAINTTSAFAAAKEAVLSFDAIEESTPKSFIYTGNICSQQILVPLITLGVGKSASAHFVEMGAKVYGPKGYRFYYADERKADGAPAYMAIDGDAHAEHYLKLATEEKPSEWLQTFVKGKGYVKF